MRRAANAAAARRKPKSGARGATLCAHSTLGGGGEGKIERDIHIGESFFARVRHVLFLVLPPRSAGCRETHRPSDANWGVARASRSLASCLSRPVADAVTETVIAVCV